MCLILATAYSTTSIAVVAVVALDLFDNVADFVENIVPQVMCDPQGAGASRPATAVGCAADAVVVTVVIVELSHRVCRLSCLNLIACSM
jgi:hypothetical protein